EHLIMDFDKVDPYVHQLKGSSCQRPHMQCPCLPPPASCPRLAFVTFSAPTPLLCLRLASPRSVLLLKPAPPAPKFFDLDGGGVWVRLTNVGAVVTSRSDRRHSAAPLTGLTEGQRRLRHSDC
ncbi:hypothetical protein ACJX0J_005600, partial [Zea mays]